MDIGNPDSIIHLSDIDGSIEKLKTEQPKLNSVIVKPGKPKPKAHHSNHKRKHSLHESRRSSVKKRVNGRIAVFNSTNRSHTPNIETRVVRYTTSNIAVQTETRGTHINRTGPCKCARKLQRRNKRKRSETKTNKQIVDTLECFNINKFSN